MASDWKEQGTGLEWIIQGEHWTLYLWSEENQLYVETCTVLTSIESTVLQMPLSTNGMGNSWVEEEIAGREVLLQPGLFS